MLRMAPELVERCHSSRVWFCRHSTIFSRLLDQILDDLKDKPQRLSQALDPEASSVCCERAQGLTLKEAENVFAKTLVLDGKLDADDVTVVFSEKQQIIRKSGLLEYYESQEEILERWPVSTSSSNGSSSVAVAFSDQGCRVWAAGSTRRVLAGRAGLWQEFVCESDFKPMAVTAPAI